MNPLISTVFSADPSAHVWDGDDRIWIYASHDQPGTNTHDTMQTYHVFSSEDMVNWIDYGCVLALEDVKWAVSHMWAIDAAYRNDKYYLIFCAVDRESGEFKTGLAISDLPQGPFKDMGFIKGVHWGQDPALFIDEDNTPYLYWGAGGSCFACQLTDDLTEAIEGTIVNLTAQLTWVFEGPWVHKYNQKYYLSYPGLYEKQWPEHMYYAISDNPLGPFEYAGEYIPVFEGQAGTNHGSMIEYKGRWYAFHHSTWIAGISECRNIMCDYLEYDETGLIKPIVPTKEGVSSTEDPSDSVSKVTIVLDAAGAPMMRGKLSGTYMATELKGYSGMGYVTGFTSSNYGLTVMAQSGIDRKCRLKMRYSNPFETCTKKILVNEKMLCPEGVSQDVYDKLFKFETCSEWQEVYIADIELKTGENLIRFYNGKGNMLVDCFILEEINDESY